MRDDKDYSLIAKMQSHIFLVMTLKYGLKKTKMNCQKCVLFARSLRHYFTNY